MSTEVETSLTAFFFVAAEIEKVSDSFTAAPVTKMRRIHGPQ
jgi:hypothetical protein